MRKVPVVLEDLEVEDLVVALADLAVSVGVQVDAEARVVSAEPVAV